MTTRRKSGAANGDFAVGYGRPPLEHRFQKGRSGNPRGRPKGSKSLPGVLSDILARRVMVMENGKPRRLQLLDVVIQRLINDAARGDFRATRLILDLCKRYDDDTDRSVDIPSLAAEDQAIIDSYFEALKPEPRGEAPVSASTDGTLRSSRDEPSETGGESS